MQFFTLEDKGFFFWWGGGGGGEAMEISLYKEFEGNSM
jgi:hypothetical protein